MTLGEAGFCKRCEKIKGENADNQLLPLFFSKNIFHPLISYPVIYYISKEACKCAQFRKVSNFVDPFSVEATFFKISKMISLGQMTMDRVSFPEINDEAAERAEQDQIARMRRLILLYTFCKINP